MPLGNGDLGALLWTSGSRLILALNKCGTLSFVVAVQVLPDTGIASPRRLHSRAAAVELAPALHWAQ